MRTADRRRRSVLILALFLIVFAGGATVAYRRAFVSSRQVSLLDSIRAGIVGTIQATTSTGRQGTYYLPPDYGSETLPLLVMLHGTGGKSSIVKIGRAHV